MNPRFNFLLVILLATSACNLTAHKRYGFTDKTQLNRGAAQVFVTYFQAAQSAESAMSLIKFYDPLDRENIEKLMGWHLFAYTAIYKAAKNGQCSKTTLKYLGPNRAQIDCKGSYRYAQLFGGTHTDETMYLRVFLKQRKGKWYLDRSGMQHTQDNRKSDRLLGYGLKFATELGQVKGAN